MSAKNISSLNRNKQKVIEEFKAKIIDDFPDKITKVIIFGSKARGQATEDSDIDILVIIKSKDWRMMDAIREIGYELDEDIDYKLSIIVLPDKHVQYLRENNFKFIESIDKDGITI